MTREERTTIELTCRDLVNRLTQFSDWKKKKESSELFTPTGTWVRGGKPYTGRAAIIASFEGSQTDIIRHLATGTVIDVQDQKNASGVTYYLVYRHDPKTESPTLPMPLGTPFSMGEWHDRFVKADDGWLISHREVRRLFQG